MKRKIIKLGQATFVLSLPSKWIREQELSKGDYIEVAEKDSALILTTELGTKPKETELMIDVSEYTNRSINVVLHQAYRKGFDKLIIKYKRDQIGHIRKLVKDTLLGFEIVSEAKDKCVLQNIAEPTFEKFDVILRKQMLLIKHDVEEMYESIKNGEFDIEQSKYIKKTFDNFNNFIRRLVIRNKVGGTNSYLLYYFISQLSRIQHSYYYFFKQYCKNGKKVSKSVLDSLDALNKAYVEVYEAYYKKDISLPDKARSSVDKAVDDIHEKIGKEKGFDCVLLSLLQGVGRGMASATTVLFGLHFEDPTNNA